MGSRLVAVLRVLAATALVVALARLPPVLATRQAGQLPRPSFTSSVDIVSVDVNVIDKNGRPVRDLAAGDFTLTVDGKPRKIASAQFVSVTAPTVGPEPTPVDYSTNVGAAAGRLIVIIVDRGNIAPVRSKDVLAAAARFVSRLGPSDRVALFSIPSGPAIDFTTDHDAVTSALQRIDGQADPGPNTKNVGIAEAMQIESGNNLAFDELVARECGSMIGIGPGNTGGSELMLCRRAVKEEASIVAAYAHERARNALAGLYNILERLGSSETPKTLVLVSEALIIEGERAATANLGRAVAAAHATIYALKPEPPDSDASQARAPQGRARDRAVREEGLSAVARIGGGEVFRIIADPDFAFDRLASELSGYYLLGFEPEAADRDGKQHSISVGVKRSDVAVRSRLEFTFGRASRQTDQQAIADLLRSPAVATDLPFRLTTYAFQDPATPKIRLLVAMETDRAADPGGHMALGIVLVKPGGDVGATFFQPSVGAPTDASAKPQRSYATLLVDPGQYILKAAILDSDGRRGSIERPVRAYMTRVSRFRATELLIGDDTDRPAVAAAVVPTITGALSGDQLHFYLELFAEGAAAFEGAAATLEISPEGSSTVVESVPASLQRLGDDERCRAVTGAVPVALLSRGPYVARVVISVNGQKVGQMTRPFRLVKP